MGRGSRGLAWLGAWTAKLMGLEGGELGMFGEAGELGGIQLAWVGFDMETEW